MDDDSQDHAGRQKDFDDVVFLLGQPQLVNRPTIKQKMVEVGGEDAWLIMLPGLRCLCDLADQNTKAPNKYDAPADS